METLLDVITVENAPQPIGPYSQAIRAGGFLFCSGQIPIDPATGEFVDGSIETQTTLVLNNLRAVLIGAGLRFANVVKTTIFVTDLADFATVNRIYEEAIGSARPARSTIQVAALPKGARVEIECIAFAG